MRRFLRTSLLITLVAVGFFPSGSVRPESAAHWAYQPLQRPEPPVVKATQSVRNPIDNFVTARLEKEGIVPSPAAERHVLIRRLYLDLVGLPPSPEDVDAFLKDDSEEAYEALVDRVMASRHFGERWGRHWLDKARYADSDGYEKDRPRPNAWRYRDWVIQAVNKDLPFDQFTREQLAGDLLAEPTADQRLATAFHRQTLTNTEGGVDQEQFRVEAIVDRINTTGAIWLGLTVGCAQCHSHKYDRISHEEYYQFFAFFNNADETHTEVPISQAEWGRFEEEKAKHAAEIAGVEAELEARGGEVTEEFSSWTTRLRGKSSDPDLAVFAPLNAEKLEAADGDTQFEQLEDGSYLVSGANPEEAKYTFVARSDGVERIRGFRLEILPHETLENGGPGRSAEGAFALRELRAYSYNDRTLDPANVTPVEFRFARSSGAGAASIEAGATAFAAIDGDPETAWTVSAAGQVQEGFFFTSQPFERRSAYFTLVLDQRRGSIGRFRVTAIHGDDEVLRLPELARAALQAPPGAGTEAQNRALLDYFVTQVDETGQDLERKRLDLVRNPPKPPLMQVRVLSERDKERRTTHLLHRGDFLQPRDEVRPGTLEVLHPLARSGGGSPSRLDLAQWLVDSSNPLTPRVVVNQIWEPLFGHGLVRSTDDFGVRGELPSHPELLDWLATEFRRLKWSRKALIKKIVTSATYRRSSRHRPELDDVDPENRLLYRQNRFRVEAEIVRDLALAVSGLLEREVGGPSVFPPMAPGIAALSYANSFKWETSTGPARYRRGLYTFFKRTAPHPTLITFDCPDANTTCAKRRTSNTPLQALTTLNNTVFAEAAAALAARVLGAPRATDKERLALAFRLCLVREAEEAELVTLRGLLKMSRRFYEEHPEEAKQLVGYLVSEGVDVPEVAASDVPVPELAAPELAAWSGTLRVFLNLDEFITRE